MRGKDFCGYCAAKRKKFFGWRLHLICTTGGVPVAFDLLPGGRHDLTPIHELTHGLPARSTVHGDKACNAAGDAAAILAGRPWVPCADPPGQYAPNDWADKLALRAWRKRIEALFSQLEAMGAQRLRARTNPGLLLKYLVRGGWAWRLLPRDVPPWPTV